MGPRVSYPRCNKPYGSRLKASRFPRMGKPGMAGGVRCSMMPNLLNSLDRQTFWVDLSSRCTPLGAATHVQGTPQYRLAEPPRLLNVSRHALVQHPSRSCAIPLALLQGEMTLLILHATPTPTGRVPAQLRLPRGAGALGPRRPARHGGRVLCRPVRGVEVPRQLRHQAAPGRIGLRELMLLRRRQVP